MKLSDDACDVGDDKSLAIALGLLCAITSAFATVSSASAAYIFIGILIGNLLALKVDGIHHIITLVLFVLISLVMGIPELSVVILLICIFSALLDTNSKSAEFFKSKIAYVYVIFVNVIFISSCLYSVKYKHWRKCVDIFKKSASKYYKNTNKLFIINKISMVWLDFLIHYLFRQQNT